MPELETKIHMALKARITRAAGTLPIAWPGEAYEVETGTDGLPKPFLAVGEDYAAPIRRTVGEGPSDRMGSVTLSHVAPATHPQAWHREKASLVAAHFKRDSCEAFQGIKVRFFDEPHVTAGFQDGAMWRVPVIIRWRCFA